MKANEKVFKAEIKKMEQVLEITPQGPDCGLFIGFSIKEEGVEHKAARLGFPDDIADWAQKLEKQFSKVEGGVPLQKQQKAAFMTYLTAVQGLTTCLGQVMASRPDIAMRSMEKFLMISEGIREKLEAEEGEEDGE